jgi:hypothetical protein
MTCPRLSQSFCPLPELAPYPLPQRPQYPSVQVYIVSSVILKVQAEVGHFREPGSSVDEQPDQHRIPPGLKVIPFVTLEQ